MGSGLSKTYLSVDPRGFASPSEMRYERKKCVKGDPKIPGLSDWKDEFPFSLIKEDFFKVYSFKNLPQIPSGSIRIQIPPSFYKQGSQSTGN